MMEKTPPIGQNGPPLSLSAQLAEADARAAAQLGERRFSAGNRPLLRILLVDEATDALAARCIHFATRTFRNAVDYCLCVPPGISSRRVRQMLAYADQPVEWHSIQPDDNPPLTKTLAALQPASRRLQSWLQWFPDRIRSHAPEMFIRSDMLITAVPAWFSRWHAGDGTVHASRRFFPDTCDAGANHSSNGDPGLYGFLALPAGAAVTPALLEILCGLPAADTSCPVCRLNDVVRWSLERMNARFLQAPEAALIPATGSIAAHQASQQQWIVQMMRPAQKTAAPSKPESAPELLAFRDRSPSEAVRWLGSTGQWGVPGWGSHEAFSDRLAEFARQFAGKQVLELGTSRGRLSLLLARAGCVVTTIDHADRGAGKNLAGTGINVVVTDAAGYLASIDTKFEMIVVDLHGNTVDNWQKRAAPLVDRLNRDGVFFLNNARLYTDPQWHHETGVEWFIGQHLQGWPVEYFLDHFPGFAMARRPDAVEPRLIQPREQEKRDMRHIVYCFDENYLQHFSASVTSLLLNYQGKSDELCIHVITDRVMGRTAQIVSDLAGRFRAEFKLHAIPDAWTEFLTSAPVTGRYRTSVYWNFFIAELLPQDLGKVLYLDADTIVVSDISELLALPLADATIAAVSDLSADRMTRHWGIPNYVNNGVMLINLDRWRAAGYSTRCFEFCREQSEKLVFLDQCAINVVLSGDIRLLPERWNGFVHEQAPDESDSAILHYLTAIKPWQSWYAHPLGSLYWRYLNVTPFAGAEPDQPRTVPERILLAKCYTKQGRYKEAVDLYNSFRFEPGK